MILNCVVAVDGNWGIGLNGNLLFRNKDDLRYFRQLTQGHTVITGRKTLATFPKGEPLKNRRNIVLSRTKDGDQITHKTDDDTSLVYCASVEETFKILKETENKGECTAFIIGGGEIYRQFLPFCRLAYVTKFSASTMADTFFENLDENPDWKIQTQFKFDSQITFCVYKNTINS